MTHPILAATADISAALKSVASVNPTFMTTLDKAEALRALARAEAQLAALKLRVLADSGDVAETTAAKTVADWYADATRSRYEDARAGHRLAVALDRRYPALASGLAEGEVNLAQAQVIAAALDALPGEVTARVLTRAEEALIGHCASFGPRQLARLGRHVLAVVAPDHADAAEARQLTALEAAAHRKTRLTLRRIGDGTTRLSGLIPDVSAARLATYLEAFTNPATADPTLGDDTVHARSEPDNPLARLTYPRRTGEAFCHLLDAIDPQRLPLHAGDATTLLVTIPLDALRTELATAEIIGASNLPGTDEPVRITADQARRLACTVGIIPIVLGGESEILDLGRRRRLYSPAQRKALAIRDRHCRAEGCTIPALWCHAHHDRPWTLGGPTDLVNALLLCHHHHVRVHDPVFTTERLANGDLRFHRRR